MADPGKQVGIVTHFYDHLSVGIIKLSNEIKKGDVLRFVGNTTNFEQIIDDMQFEHEFVDIGKVDQEIGVKVKKKVRTKDKVYLVE